MSTTLSIRLDPELKKRLDALAERSNRSTSLLAAEAIASYVEAQEWQLAEIRGGMKDLEEGNTVSHADVSAWLDSWGRQGEKKAPRRG